MQFNKRAMLQTLKTQGILEIPARNYAESRFNKAKRDMLKQFDSSKVTQELQGGPDAANLSGTLGGYGNLFSFIGFNAGDDPAGQVREVLERNTYFEKRLVETDILSTGIRYRFIFRMPTREDFDSFGFPDDWYEGRNWVMAIEQGISGFQFYIYGLFDEHSRSGTGLQAKNRRGQLQRVMPKAEGNSPTQYRPVEYVSSILNNFLRNLRLS